MGSDTRMNKCFVRNTVPNRAGSRKKTRRAHVPREQLSPTLQLETMSLPNSNVRLPVAGPPAAFHKCPSHHSKLWHGTATIGKPFLSSLTKYAAGHQDNEPARCGWIKRMNIQMSLSILLLGC